MSAFSIRQNWIGNGADEGAVAATFARLQIFIGKQNIAEHKAVGSKLENALSIPSYFLAEWIAENWWVLLFEPRKDDEADDGEYLSRHSLISAQGGFPLPGLTIVPTGRGIDLNCRPRFASHANVRFTADVFAEVAREQVEEGLSNFIDQTVRHLLERGHPEASFVQIWENIKSLSEDERRFCELMGSLGTSPDDASDELFQIVEWLYETLGYRATRDLCLAATAEQLPSSREYIRAANRTLDAAAEAALSPLLQVGLPPENYSAPSWRRGKAAAKQVRESLGLDFKNPNAADVLFAKMGIDLSAQPAEGSTSGVIPFSGAIARIDGRAKIALLQPELLSRRFSAARAAYLACLTETNNKRLVTNAVTRDQQASRAFAAELLIPQEYLRSLSGTKRQLHPDQVREAASVRKVSPDVAFKQASNASIRVHRF